MWEGEYVSLINIEKYSRRYQLYSENKLKERRNDWFVSKIN